jgi:hypothetical protein
VKPGDRVTSPLLVGEWTVVGRYDSSSTFWIVRQGSEHLLASDHTLTLVAPPLPPEPPVGSVVFVDGVAWWRTGEYFWRSQSAGKSYWSDIAARAVPAVDPTNDDHLKAAGLCRVAEAIDWLNAESIASPYYLGRFQARFGGAS